MVPYLFTAASIVLTRRDDRNCFADALAEAQSIINAARGGTPHSKVNFGFAGAFRLDFAKRKDYQAIKSTQRAAIERLLGGKYRCYWNRDVIQVYAAQDYEQVDETTTAEYFIQVIKYVAGVLKGFALTIPPTRTNTW